MKGNRNEPSALPALRTHEGAGDISTFSHYPIRRAAPKRIRSQHYGAGATLSYGAMHPTPHLPNSHFLFGCSESQQQREEEGEEGEEGSAAQISRVVREILTRSDEHGPHAHDNGFMMDANTTMGSSAPVGSSSALEIVATVWGRDTLRRRAFAVWRGVLHRHLRRREEQRWLAQRHYAIQQLHLYWTAWRWRQENRQRLLVLQRRADRFRQRRPLRVVWEAWGRYVRQSHQQERGVAALIDVVEQTRLQSAWWRWWRWSQRRRLSVALAATNEGVRLQDAWRRWRWGFLSIRQQQEVVADGLRVYQRHNSVCARSNPRLFPCPQGVGSPLHTPPSPLLPLWDVWWRRFHARRFRRGLVRLQRMEELRLRCDGTWRMSWAWRRWELTARAGALGRERDRELLREYTMVWRVWAGRERDSREVALKRHKEWIALLLRRWRDNALYQRRERLEAERVRVFRADHVVPNQCKACLQYWKNRHQQRAHRRVLTRLAQVARRKLLQHLAFRRLVENVFDIRDSAGEGSDDVPAGKKFFSLPAKTSTARSSSAPVPGLAWLSGPSLTPPIPLRRRSTSQQLHVRGATETVVEPAATCTSSPTTALARATSCSLTPTSLVPSMLSPAGTEGGNHDAHRPAIHAARVATSPPKVRGVETVRSSATVESGTQTESPNDNIAPRTIRYAELGRAEMENSKVDEDAEAVEPEPACHATTPGAGVENTRTTNNDMFYSILEEKEAIKQSAMLDTRHCLPVENAAKQGGAAGPYSTQPATSTTTTSAYAQEPPPHAVISSSLAFSAVSAAHDEGPTRQEKTPPPPRNDWLPSSPLPHHFVRPVDAEADERGPGQGPAVLPSDEVGNGGLPTAPVTCAGPVPVFWSAPGPAPASGPGILPSLHYASTTATNASIPHTTSGTYTLLTGPVEQQQLTAPPTYATPVPGSFSSPTPCLPTSSSSAAFSCLPQAHNQELAYPFFSHTLAPPAVPALGTDGGYAQGVMPYAWKNCHGGPPLYTTPVHHKTVLQPPSLPTPPPPLAGVVVTCSPSAAGYPNDPSCDVLGSHSHYYPSGQFTALPAPAPALLPQPYATTIMRVPSLPSPRSVRTECDEAAAAAAANKDVHPGGLLTPRAYEYHPPSTERVTTTDSAVGRHLSVAPDHHAQSRKPPHSFQRRDRSEYQCPAPLYGTKSAGDAFPPFVTGSLTPPHPEHRKQVIKEEDDYASNPGRGVDEADTQPWEHQRQSQRWHDEDDEDLPSLPPASDLDWSMMSAAELRVHGSRLVQEYADLKKYAASEEEEEKAVRKELQRQTSKSTSSHCRMETVSDETSKRRVRHLENRLRWLECRSLRRTALRARIQQLMVAVETVKESRSRGSASSASVMSWTT